MSAALSIVIGLVASLLAGLCAYADGALLSVEAEPPPVSPKIAALVARRDRAHRTLAFARVALQVGAGTACALAVQATTGVLAKLPLLVFVLAGIAVVFLSETTARDAGERAGIPALERTLSFIETVERGLVAVVMLGEWLDRALERMIPARESGDMQNEESVAQFRKVVTAEMDPDTQETSILAGVFSLGDATVAEVMTPRVDIVGIERDASWSDVIARVRSSEHSRLLVHDGNLDHIVGVLHAKDLLPFVVGITPPPTDWTNLVRPTAFIPASKRAATQLREFRNSGRHIAVVADEFGGTAGIVTIEDILRIVLSGIRDEFDEHRTDIELQGDGRYRVSGRLSLERISEIVGDDLRHDDVTTMGGLTYELLGRVPHQGDSAKFKDWQITVDRVKRRRVEFVTIGRRNHETTNGDKS